jgi:hypothetical protein
MRIPKSLSGREMPEVIAKFEENFSEKKITFEELKSSLKDYQILRDIRDAHEGVWHNFCLHFTYGYPTLFQFVFGIGSRGDLNLKKTIGDERLIGVYGDIDFPDEIYEIRKK